MGVALNGVPFFGGVDYDGTDLLALADLDECGGSADVDGVYAYMREPTCIGGASGVGASHPALGELFWCSAKFVQTTVRWVRNFLVCVHGHFRSR